jgi:hypothetical protein
MRVAGATRRGGTRSIQYLFNCRFRKGSPGGCEPSGALFSGRRGCDPTEWGNQARLEPDYGSTTSFRSLCGQSRIRDDCGNRNL